MSSRGTRPGTRRGSPATGRGGWSARHNNNAQAVVGEGHIILIPSPDPTRLAVPKAYVTLAPGHQPTRETALAILRFAREHLAPYQRIRRLEFGELPKTISGKLRSVELLDEEDERLGGTAPAERAALEFWEEDFPELKR
jgi:acetyl-CoA synthetase